MELRATFVDEIASEHLRHFNAAVEAAIKDGAKRVEGTPPFYPYKIVWTVPRWRDNPWRRARFTWVRWRHMRSS